MSKKLTQYERGWIEAFIDAEGCLMMSRQANHNSFSPRLAASSTTREQLHKLQNILGGSVFGPSKPYKNRPENWKPTFGYRLYPEALRVFLPQIRLISKDTQRILLIEALVLTRVNYHQNGNPHLQRLEEIYQEIKRLNKRGTSNSKPSNSDEALSV